MAQQNWKIVVTKLGASEVLHEQEVQAGNWMAALRSARQSMGERPSVPPGSSCSIDSKGIATVLDPGSRRKFSLTPFALAAAAKLPEPSAESKPEPEPMRKPSAPQPSPAAPAAAPTPQAPAASAAAADTNNSAKKKRFETVAFVPAQLAAPPPAATQKKQKFQTVAYMPSAERAPTSGPAHRGVAAPAEAPVSVPMATAPQPPQPAPRPASTPTSETAANPGGRLAGLAPLMERNEDPSPSNPLCYRERAYVLAPGMGLTEAEAAMRFALADLQKELERRPKGKFVNLALFDHRWTEAPSRPPLIVLQWRDWREDIVVDYPATQLPEGRERSDADIDDRLSDVFEALDQLSRIGSAADGLDFAVRLLERVVPSEAISGCIYDINTDELRFVAVLGAAAAGMQGRAIPRNAGLFGQALRNEASATLVHDVMLEPSFNPAVDSRDGLDARNMLLKPLVSDGHLLGAFQLINRAQADTFTAQDAHLVGYVSERVGDFLRDVRLRRH